MEKGINTTALTSIARSYSRKVQFKQFEPTDIFCSLNYAWFDDYPTDEEVKEKGAELYGMCVAMVEEELKDLAEASDKPF